VHEYMVQRVSTQPLLALSASQAASHYVGNCLS